MENIKILDLFCKAGGASYGMFWVDPLHIDITGVDIEAQRNYPFKFIQSDFREIDLSNYDFIWASPPCQKFSRSTPDKTIHTNLIPACRSLLNSAGCDYVIENVPCSPLNTSLKLRGEMFNLNFRKERWFETSFFILSPGTSRLKPKYTISGNSNSYDRNWKISIGMEWINYKEFKNAVPPEYSYYILKNYFEQQH